MKEIYHYVASEEDIPFISVTYNENIACLHGIERSYDVWQELLADTNSVYYIVCIATPVAWFRIDLEENELWLGMLQVRPLFHRQGIGKHIVAIVEDIAREKGIQRIGIHTTEDNLPARALYSSAGYDVTEIGTCTTADGEERVGYTFEKQLVDIKRSDAVNDKC